jgi:mono/diheme cytochrome c family protein
MAEELLLGLFQDATSTSDAIGQLRQLGVTDEQITVMSDVPYEPEVLARRPVRGRLPIVTLAGAILGALTALFLTVGVFLLYPLMQGGQPLIPVPPSLIILFEMTMLGTMWAAFFGFAAVNRLPAFGRPAYDPRITAGDIGVLARMDAHLVARAEDILRASGAHDVRRLEVTRRVNSAAWARFAAAVVILLGFGAATSLLFFYDVIHVPFASQMVDQDSIGYEQGPRLAAPAEAVPVHGPALIAGRPASEPIAATGDSLQRGQVLFGINCALCHGESGIGDGPLNKYFSPQPFDLTSEHVHSLPDDVFFLIVTQGLGPMPGLSENLRPSERWDVINYVRSLRGGGE